MEPSVFGDRTRIPTDRELEAVLGPAILLWGALKATLAVEFDPVVEAWSFAGKAHGWSLRLRRRDRAIVYLTPLPGGFRASLALPERAVPVALESHLPGPIRAVVAGAQAYPEGRAVRIEVTSEDDVASVMTLARIRMAC
ncbi:MAG: DUF3788 family protein [Chloroflexota bacterium]